MTVELFAWPAEQLLIAAGVGPGTRVLDVGTGPGTVAALALARGADVDAVDAAPEMAALARTTAPAAEVCAATLPDLPFADASFDAVVANVVALTAPGVEELRRVVRPGGRVAVAVRPHPQPPLHALWGEVLAAAGLAAPPDPADDVPRTADGLAGLLAAAGLEDARCDTLTWIHRADPEAWWRGAAPAAMPPTALAAVRRAYDDAVAPHLDAGGRLALPATALLGSAHVAAPHAAGAAVVAATTVSAR